MVGGGRSY
jgi:serine/threonine protein kinase